MLVDFWLQIGFVNAVMDARSSMFDTKDFNSRNSIRNEK